MRLFPSHCSHDSVYNVSCLCTDPRHTKPSPIIPRRDSQHDLPATCLLAFCRRLRLNPRRLLRNTLRELQPRSRGDTADSRLVLFFDQAAPLSPSPSSSSAFAVLSLLHRITHSSLVPPQPLDTIREGEGRVHGAEGGGGAASICSGGAPAATAAAAALAASPFPAASQSQLDLDGPLCSRCEQT